MNEVLINDEDEKSKINSLLELIYLFNFDFNIRKIFITDFSAIITASGILLYKYRQNKLMFLCRNIDGIIEDFGGGSKPSDENVQETALNVIKRESNNKLDISINRLNDSYYSRASKYMVYFVESVGTENFIKGSFIDEKNKNVSLEWVDFKFFENKANKIHNRLSKFGIYNKMKEIYYKCKNNN